MIMSRLAVPTLALAGLALAGCMSETTMGTNQGPVTGAAGPSGAQGASAQLERCDRALGTIALVEGQDPVLAQRLAGSLVRTTGNAAGEWWEVESGEFMGWVSSRSLRPN